MADVSLRKLLPQNSEAEASLLSGIMIDNRVFSDIQDIISPDDFYKPAHQKIFTAIIELFKKSEPVDLVTLVNLLREKGQLEEINGASYLASLIDTVPLAVNAPHYANIIKKKAVLRDLINTASEIYNMGFSEEEPDNILNYAAKKISHMGISKSRRIKNIGECVTSLKQRLEDRRSGIDKSFTVNTGFKSLDTRTQGFGGGELILISARPAHGKTSLATSMILNMVGDGIPVLFFSLEMSESAFIDNRILPVQSGISSYLIRNPNKIKDADDKFALDNTIELLDTFPFYIDESPNPHYSDIVKQIRYCVREHGVRIVFIDQLSFIQGDKISGRPDMEIGSITHALKGVAKELNIPIVLLSQINREADKRPEKRPMLSDLKNSGSQEEDADLVLFIYRPSAYDRKNDIASINKQDKVDIIIAKQRNGVTGVIEDKIFFNQKTTKFYEVNNDYRERS